MAQSSYFKLLVVLFLLFCFRVAAQLTQAFHPVTFLPSFSAWQSGALPYWVLVTCQLAIIIACVLVLLKFAKGTMSPDRNTGKICLVLGMIYLSVMLFRLIAGLTFAAGHSWFGARIPTFFHIVLASFLLVLGHFHYRYGKQKETIT